MKIILSTVVALFLLGCSDNGEHKTVEKKTVPMEKKQEVKKAEVKKAEVKKSEIHSSKKVVEVAPVKTEVVAKKIAVVQKAQKIDAQKLFKVCSSCHGSHAEKSALNKSQVIRGWEASKIVQALNGYKNGTYGGAMKGIMKGQATKLNDKQIEALAKYISKL